jgi:Uncharacterized protein involved in response to NO
MLIGQWLPFVGVKVPVRRFSVAQNRIDRYFCSDKAKIGYITIFAIIKTKIYRIMEIQNGPSENRAPGRRNNRAAIITGIVLIAVGFLLVSVNLNYLPHNFHRIIISWQMLLIVIGIIQLAKREVTSGIVLLLVGGFFIMPKLSSAFPNLFPWVSYNFVASYWPILLIVAGILVIAFRQSGVNVYYGHSFRQNRRDRRERREGRYRKNYNGEKEYHHDRSNSDYGPSPIDQNSVFGDKEYVVLDEVFQGGDINTVFGGMTVDLRSSSLKEGDTYLEVNVVFGGITVYVPNDWFVEFRLENVFGAIQDKRRMGEITEPSKRLIIVGKCVFGGGEIRN